MVDHLTYTKSIEAKELMCVCVALSELVAIHYQLDPYLTIKQLKSHLKANPIQSRYFDVNLSPDFANIFSSVRNLREAETLLSGCFSKITPVKFQISRDNRPMELVKRLFINRTLAVHTASYAKEEATHMAILRVNPESPEILEYIDPWNDGIVFASLETLTRTGVIVAVDNDNHPEINNWHITGNSISVK
jgi:hypothetical protein